MITKMKKWLLLRIRHILYDVNITKGEIERIWKERYADVAKAWKDYKLYEWRRLFKPLAFIVITWMNILYTLVMYVGCIIVSLLLGIILPILYIVVGVPMMILSYLIDVSVRWMKHKPVEFTITEGEEE